MLNINRVNYYSRRSGKRCNCHHRGENVFVGRRCFSYVWRGVDGRLDEMKLIGGAGKQSVPLQERVLEGEVSSTAKRFKRVP